MKSKFSNPPGDTCECIRSEFLIHGLKRSFCSLRTYRSCILCSSQREPKGGRIECTKSPLDQQPLAWNFCSSSVQMLDKCSSPNATHQTQLAKSISPFTRTIAGFTGDLTKIFETIRVCTSRIAHIGTCRFCFRFWILNSAHRPLCDGKVSKAHKEALSGKRNSGHTKRRPRKHEGHWRDSTGRIEGRESSRIWSEHQTEKQKEKPSGEPNGELNGETKWKNQKNWEPQRKRRCKN